MDSKRLLTCAALGAACLWPVAGAGAQAPADATNSNPPPASVTTTETTTTATPPAPAAPSVTTTETTTTTSDTIDMSGTIMDAGVFRDNLHKVRKNLMRIRENRDLALASQDPMVASSYDQQNKNLVEDTLATLDEITRQWRHREIRPIPGETAEVVNGRSEYGAADMQRFANESEDTAFVRNAVWDIQSQLEADKLNGREVIVTRAMMSELDTAIARSENPDFRVARAFDASKLDVAVVFPEHKPFVWDRSHDMVAQVPTTQSTTTEEVTTSTPAPTPPPPAATESTTNTTGTTEESTVTSEQRTGAANLPQTGGDPGLFVLVGSTLIGLGGALRRRR